MSVGLSQIDTGLDTRGSNFCLNGMEAQKFRRFASSFKSKAPKPTLRSYSDLARPVEAKARPRLPGGGASWQTQNFRPSTCTSLPPTTVSGRRVPPSPSRAGTAASHCLLQDSTRQHSFQEALRPVPANLILIVYLIHFPTTCA